MLCEKYKICNSSRKSEVVFDLKVMPPIKNENGYYVRIQMDPVCDEIKPIAGDTALQALQNSIQFINRILKEWHDQGFKLYSFDSVSGEYFEVEVR